MHVLDPIFLLIIDISFVMHINLKTYLPNCFCYVFFSYLVVKTNKHTYTSNKNHVIAIKSLLKTYNTQDKVP